MAKTGPQKIPGASQAYFYGTGRYSGADMEVNCGVVHTTEGRSLPSYNGGAMAPTVTGMPNIKGRTIRWYQHYDVDESARALANKLGGVETNTANAFQIELVGTCDDKYRTTWSGAKAGVDYLHWPTAPDWALVEVAWLVKWLNQNHGIPLTCVKDWLAYGKDSRRPGITPASYGASPARMTFAQWRSFKGWCGHQHVPENDHGDPGSMDFARVIQLAKGETSSKEETVAITDDDARKIARTVLTMDGVIANPNPSTAKTNSHIALMTSARNIEIITRRTEQQLAAQSAAITKLAELIGSGVDTDAVVAAVRDAIQDAVIKVDVDITSTPNQES